MNTKLVKASGISSLIVPVIAFVSSIAAVESKSEDWESVGGLVLASLNLVVGFIRMAMIHVDHTYCTEPQTNVHALLKFIYPWKFYVHGRLVSCRGKRVGLRQNRFYLQVVVVSATGAKKPILAE